MSRYYYGHITTARFLTPGGLLEVVFSFDTTGSMSSILDEVRGRLQDMIQRLQADIPGIRIAVIAHGDYCDKAMFYVTQHIDFTSDVKALCDFVAAVEGTGGGDNDECYELVLRMVRENFSWTSGSQRVLVMIGDAGPHAPDYELNEEHIDWNKEVAELNTMGVRIYGVQAMDDKDVVPFYNTLAETTGGEYLKLGDFSNVCHILMAICYREKGAEFLEGYEAEVRSGNAGKGIGPDLEGVFGTLKRVDSSRSSASNTGDASQTADPVVAVPAVSMASHQATTKKTGNKKLGITSQKRKIRTGTENKVSVESKRPRRETVPETKFAMNSCGWTRWRLAITSDLTGSLAGKWYKRRSGGRKRVNLFTPDNKLKNKTLMYEVAVQTKPHTKKRAVFTKVSNGLSFPLKWEKALFGNRRVKQQMDSVVNQGCKIFIRRVILKKGGVSPTDKCRTLPELYDYAWSTRRSVRNHHRTVTRDSVRISDGVF
ncbi:hypothetical protein ScPMuIL_016507 [Solemya velum]